MIQGMQTPPGHRAASTNAQTGRSFDSSCATRDIAARTFVRRAKDHWRLRSQVAQLGVSVFRLRQGVVKHF